MRLSQTLPLLVAALASGCSLYGHWEPLDMTGCVPSPSCYLDGGADADMPVVLDGGDDGMCMVMCPGEDMAVDMARECVDSSTCPEDRPLCNASGACVGCTAANDAGTSNECMMFHSPKRLCGPAGACVECLSKDNCEPFNQTCNLTTHECAPCQRHADCTTGVCKAGGACASSSEVAYVNKNITCNDTRTIPSTPTDPYCQIQAAATSVSPSPRPFIVVTGSATPYNAVNLNAVAAPVGPVTIIGPGRTASPTAKIEPLGALVATPAVLVSTNGNPATVTLDGLELTGTSGGIPAPGVRCNVGSGAATMTVKNARITNSGGAGVDSSGCTLVLDANEIGPANAGGGVVLGGTTSYTVTNNIIHTNGAGVPAVDIGNMATGTFAFNTVANNGGAGTGSPPGGIVCPASARTIQHSIVVGNRLTMAGGTQFFGNCTLMNVVTGADSFTGANTAEPDLDITFRLKANATNQTCCIDKVAAPGTPNASHDVDNTPRPKGAGAMPYDTGAHELQ